MWRQEDEYARRENFEWLFPFLFFFIIYIKFVVFFFFPPPAAQAGGGGSPSWAAMRGHTTNACPPFVIISLIKLYASCRLSGGTILVITDRRPGGISSSRDKFRSP